MIHKNKFNSLIFSLFILAISISSSAFAQRGPSTEEERARVVALAKASDLDPRAVMESEDGMWFLNWRREVPEYEIGLDKGAYWAKTAVKGDLRKATRFHHLLSVAAFQVQHQILNPKKNPEDELAVTQAGIEGLLRAYENLLPRRPANFSKKMDEALKRRNMVDLKAFVINLPPIPED
ncbi:hypothetical protein [Undibacterium danionis]|uniref:Uncharacterized protein n=1 Tax=Undibacterium danionis TaxID=1812100 RepID=A0ABV6IFT7_9BURK